MDTTDTAAPRIIIGFDFGMKRIGVAIGQTVTRTARPLDTIQAKEGVPNWSAIAKLIQKWLPDLLVVGIPLNMDGTEQPLTFHARRFATSLHQRFALPVREMDERLTTKAAREQLFQQHGYQSLQHGQVDRVAAQLILQSWFAEN